MPRGCGKRGARSTRSIRTKAVLTLPSFHTLRSDCAACGLPDYYSYVAGNLKQFMDDHYIADVRQGMQGLKDKLYALFCSHGGGGRVREVMVSLFKRIGTQVGEVVASRGYPSPNVLEQCKALGKALGEAV